MAEISSTDAQLGFVMASEEDIVVYAKKTGDTYSRYSVGVTGSALFDDGTHEAGTFLRSIIVGPGNAVGEAIIPRQSNKAGSIIAAGTGSGVFGLLALQRYRGDIVLSPSQPQAGNMIGEVAFQAYTDNQLSPVTTTAKLQTFLVENATGGSGTSGTGGTIPIPYRTAPACATPAATAAIYRW